MESINIMSCIIEQLNPLLSALSKDIVFLLKQNTDINKKIDSLYNLIQSQNFLIPCKTTVPPPPPATCKPCTTAEFQHNMTAVTQATSLNATTQSK
jgi:hypothetical protein